MKDYDKNKELSSCLKYLDVNNLYGWATSQKLALNKFECIKDISRFNQGFIKNIMKKVMKDIFSKLMFSILKNYMNFIIIYHFYLNLHDKTEYAIRIRNLKHALNHGLTLKKVHRVIRFNQKAWLKSYIDMNTKLRQNAKNNFEKDFFKLMSNAVFGKTMENVRKHRNTKLVTTEKRRNYLVSEPNFHTTKFLTEN